MPSDLSSIAQPSLIVLAWAAGLAAVAAWVAQLRIVGKGFIWLTGGAAFLLTIPGVILDGGWASWIALVLMAVGLLNHRRVSLMTASLSIAVFLLLVQASLLTGWFPAITSTIALGAVTGEMMLGHWYLVDPRLPRWALRALAVAGVVGLVAEAVMISITGIPSGGPALAYWALIAVSVLLMVAVIGALRYPAYSGVMAATGLSYLAVLTTLGAVFLGSRPRRRTGSIRKLRRQIASPSHTNP